MMQRRRPSDRGRGWRVGPRRSWVAVEGLEERVVLSFGVTGALHAVPGVVVQMVPGPSGAVPFASTGPVGYTPQQLQAAYGLNQISFAGIKGDGSGQTIAIVDAYDNPSFVDSTDPSFNTSALHVFDQAYGLPDPPSFRKVNQNGDGGSLPQPAGVSGWGVDSG